MTAVRRFVDAAEFPLDARLERLLLEEHDLVKRTAAVELLLARHVTTLAADYVDRCLILDGIRKHVRNIVARSR